MVFQYKHGVYQIRHLTSNKRYIGSASSPKGFSHRWGIHRKDLGQNRHHSRHLQYAWNKYGANDFVFEILLYCDPENCLMYEQIALDYYKPEYNSCPHAHSWLGMKHSEETKIKLSQAAQKHRGHLNGFWGKKHTTASRQQMSLSSIGLAAGDKNPHAKLTTSQVLLIKKKLSDGIDCNDIASEFQVSNRIISRIAKGETWIHLDV